MGEASKWPVFRISGGVHGKNTKIEVDGVPMERVSRVEVVLDVRDAVQITTHQLGEVFIEIEAEPGSLTQKSTVVVWLNIPGEYLQREELARATADTMWQALDDCVKQLRAREDPEI